MWTRSVVATVTLLGGCAASLHEPDPQAPRSRPPACRPDSGPVAADVVGALISTAAAGGMGVALLECSNDELCAVGGGVALVTAAIAVAYTRSAVHGTRANRSCAVAWRRYHDYLELDPAIQVIAREGQAAEAAARAREGRARCDRLRAEAAAEREPHRRREKLSRLTVQCP